jgi:hypothetical protein
MRCAEDAIGQTFHRLTVIGYERFSGERTRWYCLCTCGTVKKIQAVNVFNGGTQSCGCQRLEKSKTRCRSTHGMTKTPEHRAWAAIKQRIKTQGYVDRGIRMYDEWVKSFEAFYAHVGPRPSPKHSLDRIDNNDHYEPGNVRWATATEQQRNKRDNHVVTINGQSRCIGEWNKIAGLSKGTLNQRLKLGWPEDRLLIPSLRKAKELISACPGCEEG